MLALIEDALQGARVYGFMTIARPGDVLNYLRVRALLVHADVSKLFEKTGVQKWITRDCGDDYLSFAEFDGEFRWEGDDTRPEAACWLKFRSNDYWPQMMLKIGSVVTDMQCRLRETDDYLTQREIASLDAHRHRRDFFHAVERRCFATRLVDESRSTGPSVLSVIDDLISRANVQSISCPLVEYGIWRRLVKEQVQRSERTGTKPQVAFTLSGPDADLTAPYEDWGGYVHIPYEGACGADLFIKPEWRRIFPEADACGGNLSDIVFASRPPIPSMGCVCHYLLTQEDLGPLLCAARREVGDGWVLYESNRPYEPNQMLKS